MVVNNWFFLNNQPDPNFQNEKNKKKDSIVEPTNLMCYVETKLPEVEASAWLSVVGNGGAWPNFSIYAVS